MTRLTTSSLAVNADYADALLTARRARSWLFLLVLLGLLVQIAVFILVHFDVVKIGPGGDKAQINKPLVEADLDVTTRPTTESSGATGTDTDIDASASITTRPSNLTDKPAEETALAKFIAWTVNSIVYLGSILSIVLCIVVLLIVLIMLVGRLLGVAHTTSAFVWCLVLAAMLFPWQLFHGPETSPAAPAYSSADTTREQKVRDDFRIPGVLYTWGELRHDGRFGKVGEKPATFGDKVLKWSRFAGFPVVALILLFMVQAKSGRGLKYALGEAGGHLDVTTSEP